MSEEKGIPFGDDGRVFTRQDYKRIERSEDDLTGCPRCWEYKCVEDVLKDDVE